MRDVQHFCRTLNVSKEKLAMLWARMLTSLRREMIRQGQWDMAGEPDSVLEYRLRTVSKDLLTTLLLAET